MVAKVNNHGYFMVFIFSDLRWRNNVANVFVEVDSYVLLKWLILLCWPSSKPLHISCWYIQLEYATGSWKILLK